MNSITVHVVKYSDRSNLVMRYIDPMTGKPKSKSARTPKRREAEKLAAKWEAELREGRYHEPSRVTWADFREKYEDEVLSGHADGTAQRVCSVFNMMERILSPKRLADVTAARLSYFQAELRKRDRTETTIKTHLAHIMAAFRWAVRQGMLTEAPQADKPRRAKSSKVMKGRPITTEEFERMLAKVEAVVGPEVAPSWRYYLRGLWLSGLRLGESLELTWDDDQRLRVDFDGRRPMLRIPASLEKGHKDRTLPMAPEFAEFLEAAPDDDRRGRVLRLYSRRNIGRHLSAQYVSSVICRIGKAAGVKVSTNPRTGKVKFASAHDLRRSFGERWSARLMPQQLMELMRHEDISTTMKYYVGRNAEKTADALWEAYEGHRGNILGNIAPKIELPG